MRGDEEFDSHLHHHMVSLRDLLAEWIPQVHPELLSALVLVAESEILFL